MEKKTDNFYPFSEFKEDFSLHPHQAIIFLYMGLFRYDEIKTEYSQSAQFLWEKIAAGDRMDRAYLGYAEDSLWMSLYIIMRSQIPLQNYQDILASLIENNSKIREKAVAIELLAQLEGTKSNQYLLELFKINQSTPFVLSILAQLFVERKMTEALPFLRQTARLLGDHPSEKNSDLLAIQAAISELESLKTRNYLKSV